MPSWTPQDYATFQSRNSKLRSTHTQPTQGHPLECSTSGENKGGNGAIVSPEPGRRKRIRFTVYSVSPCDWDGYHIKELQDLLVHSGIVDGDAWDILQGEVVSEKVHKKEDERTEIIIEYPQMFAW